MPLEHRASKKAFEKNVRTEMEAHPGEKHRAQDLAIAYAVKRKAMKDHEAHGGEMHEEMHMCSGGSCEHPSHKMAEGGEAPMEHMSRHDRAMHAFRGKKMAEGGMMTDMGYQSKENPEVDGDLMPEAHLKEELAEHVAHPATHDSSAEHAEMNQEGDEDEGAGDMDSIHPVVMKIMMGRAKGYSEGGRVANEESGESTDEPTQAKWEGNEMDDLAEDDGLEFKSTGANAGDELGNESEEHDQHDIISRIMKSRSKRDRMEVPGEGSTYGRRK